MDKKSPIYKLKDSVDVYLFSNKKQEVQIQFYKINTREKLTIKTNHHVSNLLAQLDGKTTVSDLIKTLNLSYDELEANTLFDFLEQNGIVTKESHTETENPGISPLYQSMLNRYSRQINYFDDLLNTSPGASTQERLCNQNIVIFGVGAVGSSIAIHLVRAGIKRITLIDYKKVTQSNITRHLYVTKDSIGKNKTDVLKNYLTQINSDCEITCINKKLKPNCIVSDYVSKESNLVINSADEPYIGHTTLKLGRALWPKGIALYVAGGFDAHLMSTGELIAPGLTPCADCCSNTFKQALKDWKPTYATQDPSPALSKNHSEDVNETTFVIGGAGGLASQSLFSASYASINIVNYLIGNLKNKNKLSQRGEFIVNKGQMTWFELENQKGCNICGY